MKKIVPFILALFIGNGAFAQIYQLMENTTLRKIDFSTKQNLSPASVMEVYSATLMTTNNSTEKASFEMQTVKQGYLFEKYDIIGDYYILAVLPFKENEIQNKVLYNSDFKEKGTSIPNLFFLVSKSQFDSDFEENNSRLGFASVILPIKIRFGDKRNGERIYTKFESGINLGVALTYRLNKKLKSVDTYAIASLSTSQVNLDAETTNNFITSSQSALALTPSLGFLFQFKNNLQILAITGIDIISGKIGREWVYRDRPFVGIGLGFNIAQLGVKPEKN